jgi:hypothetical protein
MIKKHPSDRAERLAFKRKYSFKHSRRKGLTDETNTDGGEAAKNRRDDETPSETEVGVRTGEPEYSSHQGRSHPISGATPDILQERDH